jgi:ribonuclease H2 subunit A
MLKRNRESLNVISMYASFELIYSCLKNKVNLKEVLNNNSQVYIDTIGRPETYQKKFEEEFKNYDIKFIVTIKADSKFPVVSAASIVAKVTRDRALEDWVFEEKLEGIKFSRELGSGYPGDPKTKAWLRKSMDKVFGFPSVVRYSWKTAINLIKPYLYKVKW